MRQCQCCGDLATYESSTNFDNDLAWGWGTRITFLKGDKMSWGIALQMNWLDTSWDDEGTDEVFGAWEDELDLESYDIVVSVGPTIDMGGWKLYFGPFYYYFEGDYDLETTWADGFLEKETTDDVEADSNFGGRVGVQIPVAQNWELTAEAVMTPDGWGAGGGLALKF